VTLEVSEGSESHMRNNMSDRLQAKRKSV